MDDRKAADFAKVLSNPLRLEFVGTLHKRGPEGTLTRGEFSRQTGVGLHNLEIHIEVLREAGVLEIAEMIQRRGAMELLYSLSRPRGAAAGAVVDLLASGSGSSTDYVEAAETVSALGHPIRIAFLRDLERRGRSATLSASEFAHAAGEQPNSASYHVRLLRDAGVVAVAEEVRQRGAPEMRYRLSGPRAEVTVALAGLFKGA